MPLKNILKAANNLIFTGGDEEEQTPGQQPGASAESSSKADDIMSRIEREVGGKTLADVANAGPGPALNEVQVPPQNLAAEPKKAAAPIRNPDGSINFTPIYEQANLPKADMTAEEMLKTIEEFGDVPNEAKLVMARGVLKPLTAKFGITAETVVNDALMKVAALDSYSTGIQKQCADFVSKSQAEISQLEAQIAAKKKAMESAQARTQEMVDLCEQEGDRFEVLLNFFGKPVQPPVGV